MACGIFQWIVAQAFLWMRTRTPWYWPFPAALLLTLLPLVGARFLPLAIPGAQLGFLGISYVTFRSLDVIFGIRDRLIVSLPAGQYFAFLFFFPAISSGPIDRYRRFSQDWNRPRHRRGILEGPGWRRPPHLHGLPVQVHPGGLDQDLSGSTASPMADS